jgi:hypothetical protein
VKHAVPRVFALAVLAAAFAACSQKTTVEPVPGAPPRVTAVQPAARTTAYPYDGQIWALFDRALDPKSVDSTTVFLKQDTQRIPSKISYEPTSRRIVVAPRVLLGLQKAYTVIVSSRVLGKDGVALGQDYMWQFVTSSIRRAAYERPSPDTLASPVAYLKWSIPESAPGTLVFELYAGPDSAAIAARSVPYVYRGSAATFLPREYWPAGARTYWSVTTYHVQSGERLDSPVTSFPVYPADAPTLDLSLTVQDWGGLQQGLRTQYCNATVLNIGPTWSAGMHFPLGNYPFITNIAHVRVTMSAVAPNANIPGVGINATTAAWTACAAGYPGPPYADQAGPLALATTVNGTDLVFDSAALAAHVEAMKRSASYSGFAFTCPAGQVPVITNGLPQPTMVLTYYP